MVAMMVAMMMMMMSEEESGKGLHKTENPRGSA